MDLDVLIPLFGIFFVIGVPVMSVAAKFVLQPLLREVVEAIRGGKAQEFDELQERVVRLEEHLLTQGRQLDQLVEAELFRRRLEAGSEDAEDGPLPSVPDWSTGE
ncbi:MAG: hypothetical protein R3195_05475 [Gemmatimonadota bacterium]|nr:hypothetical protein [Gemmatimonadota bacterium]